MPTFTSIALDRLIEPGAAKSMEPVRISPGSRIGRSHSISNTRQDRGVNGSSSNLERGVSVPPPKSERAVTIPPNPKYDRTNGAANTTTSVVDKKHQWTQISPALYATPESTPLPDSPSSFPPSPYIINHKRRGPRLVKSFSEDDVATCKRATDDITVESNGNGNDAKKELVDVPKGDIFIPREAVDSAVSDSCISTAPGNGNEKYLNGIWDERNSITANGSAGQNGVLKSEVFDLQQDDEIDDFVDPLDSLSIKSTGESEANAGVERSLSSRMQAAEFYDAWEELSSESGPQFTVPDIENELREIRFSLLMEIEKRKEAEETLTNMQSQWQRIREQLSLVGLRLPLALTALPQGEQPADTAAEVCQQVYLARFVSNSIGRGTAKAEAEMEMEAQIKLKNLEIARLWDRLHYFEAVNQEMSQRNQEVVETTRRIRQRRKIRQRWVWESIATLAILGSAALAYSFFQSGKGSSSTSALEAPEVEQKSK